MEIGITAKKEYSDRIGKNIKKLEGLTPHEFYIPITQVAFRFNLGGEEMYLDYPYNETVEQQNKDFNNTLIAFNALM